MSHQELIDKLVTFKGRLERAKKAVDEFRRMPTMDEVEQMVLDAEGLDLDMNWERDEVEEAMSQTDEDFDNASGNIERAIESLDGFIKEVQEAKDGPSDSGDDSETGPEPDTRTRW